jgi:hypothetical protein
MSTDDRILHIEHEGNVGANIPHVDILNNMLDREIVGILFLISVAS